MKTLRQLWELVKHQKLYTFIYLFGTALALASVTVYAVQIHTKLAPVYPETHRMRMAILPSVKLEKPQAYTSISSVALPAIKAYLSNLNAADDQTAIYTDWERRSAQPQIEGLDFEVTRHGVDEGYFRIFDLDFIAGQPFTAADLDAHEPKALIDATTAEKIFGPADASSLIGREFTIDYISYRLAGIYRPMSEALPVSFANVIVPYTTIPDYNEIDREFIGNFELVFLTDDLEALQSELEAIANRFNAAHDGELILDFMGAPMGNAQYMINRASAQKEYVLSNFVMTTIFTFLVLLLIPAMNLSGMVAGRMEGRLPELGVRKTYGARPATLLRGLLWENLILTTIGGVLGFGAAWLIMSSGLMGVETLRGDNVEASSAMVFAPSVFAFCFVVCLVLNLLSALFPAWRALRRPIVQSLKEK